MSGAIMMSSRELRHVPKDFATPIGETWDGWFRPAELESIPCEACAQTGYSPTARWLHDTHYHHNTATGGWRDRLLQSDVDVLVDEGRWRVYVGCSLPTARHPRGVRFYMAAPRDVEAVNAAQREHGGGLFGTYSMDGINVHILVKHRCKLLGAPLACDVCGGEGYSFRDDAHREAHDAWNPQPPTGDHIQLWQTVSEGGPVSPAFPDSAEGRRNMAAWMAEHDDGIHRDLSTADWLRLINADWTGVDIATGSLVAPASPDEGRNDG